MITLGLTGWTDHPLIQRSTDNKLTAYAGHFPVVEVDTSFYGIPKEKTINNWLDQTPKTFQFIPKANNVLTLHKSYKESYDTLEEAFDAFKRAFHPMLSQNRVKAILFQFPPYFDCVKKHVTYLRFVKKQMKDLPIAVEFRHPSWFSEKNKAQTLALLKQQNWTNVIVDQPQTPNNSVPKIIEKTSSLSILRLHGRNYDGWLGEDVVNWRAERTLYNYSIEELQSFADIVSQLEKETSDVCVIFNNNSGGHAAQNAKELQALLGLTFDGLGPQQLDLF
ncbi:MAG: DUF72 domain-containing protein [Alkalibacterium sp.]|uniref:Uncharacterized conserved protein YecE, DUF72 family n=1 Tax=Alkalibacterium gilvum TaxID=1130080 RepID=A0A1H6RJ88_9LACT|nr:MULTISPECIES: DUF72 domain-containing protein [Alkalibacterium]MDN6194437.1 DUF72 domain-containing protein [Alkalibacterium sp.]MDN6294209.1 DUF72 domain-containing protein [Alkalibacterium sp.]MDN6295890.1 DUF72 domain-containing protein [Alkalibacterium sp.]MDN6327249.1 DUF72 domain-containing protein [Alkalibacterium sp.]MDN6385535.1 DUF72 domain-containing protein [Alkalibacterium sp.]